MADAPKPKRHMLHMEVPGKNCIVGYWSDDALAPDGYPPLPAPYARAVVGGLSRGVEYPDIPATYTADQMRAFVDADRAARATPSPPVAAVPATPVVWASPKQLAAMTDPDEAPHGRYLPVRKTRAGMFTEPLYAQPQPQPAQPLTDEALQKLSACGPVHCENGVVTRGPTEYRRELEARFERGWRTAEKHFGITAPSTPTPEVAQ